MRIEAKCARSAAPGQRFPTVYRAFRAYGLHTTYPEDIHCCFGGAEAQLLQVLYKISIIRLDIENVEALKRFNCAWEGWLRRFNFQ